MLPLSGGWQLNTHGATSVLRPCSSQIVPYSSLVRPGLSSCCCGRNRFHRPAAFARARRSTRTAGNGVSTSTSRSIASITSSSTG